MVSFPSLKVIVNVPNLSLVIDRVNIVIEQGQHFCKEIIGLLNVAY